MLAVFVAMGCAPMAMIMRACHSDLGAFFSSFGSVVFPCVLLWLLFVLMWIGSIAVPCILPLVTYEFYFTRAIARRTLYRVRMIFLCALLLGPLVLNLFVALRAPDLVLNSGTRPELLNQGEPPGEYLRAFPGAHNNLTRPSLSAAGVQEMILPGAALAACRTFGEDFLK
jgi:hypothetical protein